VWGIYDDLINSIPGDLTVLECMLGVSWTLVRSESGLGIAKTIKGGKKGEGISHVTGIPLKELAAYAKSWNMLEASVGMAAINAAYNTPSTVTELTGKSLDDSGDADSANAFKLLEPEVTGKKVAVIGHFPGLERLQSLCELSILEREPRDDDYPDTACEYLLPQQDYVFITGTAFTNKTMPRLLELSKQSKVILIGPSVPISRVLFHYGVDLIAGLVVIDQQLIWQAVQEGKKMSIFKYGAKMVCV